MIRRVVLLVTATLSLACASGSRQAATGGAGAHPRQVSDTVPFRLSVPKSVDRFVLTGRRDFDDRALGTQLRYLGPDSVFADAYVYPAHPALAGCGQACADSAVRAEAAEFVSLIPEYVQRGYYGAVTVASEQPLQPPPGAAWTTGRRVVLAVTRDGAAARSDFYLYLLRGYRVKVRATYPDGAARGESVRTFAEELLRLLADSRAAAP